MKFSQQDLFHSLEIADHVAEAYDMYVLASNGRIRSTDDMLWVCSEYLGKSISVVELDIPAAGRSVEAIYEAMADGTFRIGLLSGMAPDEVRFVLCKELFHVMLDRVECRNLDLYGHVEEVTSCLGLEKQPNCAAACEQLALIAAMEFLFPYNARELALAASGGNVDFAAVAIRYSIPQRFIEDFLSDHNVAFFQKVMTDRSRFAAQTALPLSSLAESATTTLAEPAER